MHLNLSRRRFLGVAGSGVAAGAAALYGMSSNDLDVVRTNTPAGVVRGIRVALLSDMHAPHELVEGSELARAVVEFDPHFVFILGDAIERSGTEALVRFYDLFPARVAKYAVLGNWEYWGACNRAALRREYEGGGTRLLVNASAEHDVQGLRVQIAGLDDARASRQDLGVVADLTRDPRALRLVLSHCPGPFPAIAGAAPGRVHTFSGHTHGGQIAPFGRAVFTPEGSGPYVAGWYAQHQHHLYVTRGIGNSGVPFRIGSRPEVTLVTV
ncbi:MAG TPA: metallophosphoesterase [Gemmatimonadaceae bacterium]|nr:metallophosphoesterase [Gemmatimonadaceae bacterium]